ncbi:MAG: hypothetical protein ACRC2R_03505 [Xenococcaceae cyanobacterium]
MNNFLSGTAVFLSAISLAFSGFTTYQLFEQQKKFGAIETTLSELKNSNSNLAATSEPNVRSTGAIEQNNNSTLNNRSTESTQPTPDATDSNHSVAIQPEQFVQFAFKDKAKVEILSLKRIKDPETQTRDVVNLQMRVRLIGECDLSCGDNIYIPQTKARNPETSEAYEAFDYKRSTGTVGLYQMKRGSSVDAYVWMKIPEGVSAVDIFVPNTAAFKNVPINN